VAVAVLIPVLQRPHRVRPVAVSALSATPDCRIVFLCTDDDTSEIEAVRAASDEFGPRIDWDVVPYQRYGDYARKINRGYQITDDEFMLFGADDLEFHDGWFEHAVAVMSDEIAVVGTQDRANRRVIAGEHSTHPLVARWYIDQCGTIDEPGKALHEGYRHEFVDDEFIATAKARSVFGFANDAVVEHLHPAVGKAPLDDLYREEPRRMVQGRVLFERRKSLWTSRS
jgi:hypothetical protein